MTPKIVFARPIHLFEVTEILNYYILNTNARFETKPFTVEDRKIWFEGFSEQTAYQMFIALDEQETVLGFACSQPYRDSIAFCNTVEVSIYLKPSLVKKGLGTALYRTLFDSLSKQDIHRALSGIALPNEASIGLHQKFGFETIGIFDEYAKKNGQFISSIWMQKKL